MEQKEKLKDFFSSCCDRRKKGFIFYLTIIVVCLSGATTNEAIDMGKEPCQLSIYNQDLEWKLTLYMQWTPTKLKPQPI
jgi:hypothetical protein